MPRVYREALLTQSAAEMFELIADIESYPEFMDGCVGSKLVKTGENQVEARLDLEKKGIRQNFTTRNTLTPNERVEMDLISGPFKKLWGEWVIREVDSGCKVTLTLEFDMGGSFLMRMASGLFEETANRLVDAICARATELYPSA